MMLHSLLVRAAALSSTCALMASCGGGSDVDAGSLTAFNIVPTSITLTGPDATPAELATADACTCTEAPDLTGSTTRALASWRSTGPR